ncbi:MAG: CPXCG motif-containing cysteine-rich protein [Candidatus Thiothrix singaporensis]|uniref:CPXCG motif-containing cysteine-rich protein n=1 Tax=Candidatus Thiothrix singaporensis TaxID=2799669 RepID=A0A7L6ATF4_9GAMM|nr:MAG: CPXCG motif-containing cysteine-rich protein [Candidatus Thiothrix singaporensis]
MRLSNSFWRISHHVAGLTHTNITCPYCYSEFSTEVDITGGSQDYYEDCQVCCNPIELFIHIDDEGKSPALKCCQAIADALRLLLPDCLAGTGEQVGGLAFGNPHNGVIQQPGRKQHHPA